VTATSSESVRDECYRCGYDLRGIANEGPCPECGLLAERSRRITDELHDTRPRWLRSLSWGISLILVAIVAAFAVPFVLHNFPSPWWIPYLGLALLDLSALSLLAGVVLLTRREGYAPADLADRRLRILLRPSAIVPALAMVLVHVQIKSNFALLTDAQALALSVLFFVLLSFLPLLLFLHLRGLARRVRSAQLAEDCIIVGIGGFASTLYVAAVIFILNKADSLGLEDHWVLRSNVSMMMMLLVGVACALFTLWAIYLLVCFAVAIWTAARTLRRKWRHDDRALTT
jgi:hypothetical protein